MKNKIDVNRCFYLNEPVFNSVEPEKDSKKTTILKVDTLICDFHILYIMKENGDTIYYKGVDYQGTKLLLKYPDRSVFLTLEYKGKTIFSKKEIRKQNFESIIPKEEISRYQFCDFSIEYVDENKVIFHLNICIPDTDICYSIEYSVSKDGRITYEEYDAGELGD